MLWRAKGHFVMGIYEGRGGINLPQQLITRLSQHSWWLANPPPSRVSSINQTRKYVTSSVAPPQLADTEAVNCAFHHVFHVLYLAAGCEPFVVLSNVEEWCVWGGHGC